MTESDTDPSLPQVASTDAFVLGGRRPGRRRTRVWVSVVLVLALSAAGAFLLTRPQGSDVALALDFQEGATQRYRLHVAMDGNVEAAIMEVPFNMEMTEVIALHVVDIDASGAATLEAEIESLTGTVDGIPIPPEAVSEVPDTRLTISPDGRVVTRGGLVFQAPTSAAGPITSANQLFPLLPDRPVGPGDSWDRDYRQPIRFADGVLEMSTDNEFSRYEDIDGVRVAVLESRFSMPLDFTIDLEKFSELAGQSPPEPVPEVTVQYDGGMEGDQTVWLDAALGEVVRSEGSADMDFSMRARGGSAAGGPFPPGLKASFTGHMSVEMERL